jgi:uncharacterized membrane protein
MAKDVSSVVRDALTSAARDALNNMGDISPNGKSKPGGKSGGLLKSAAGVAAGAALAAAAKKGVDVVRDGIPSPSDVVSGVTDKAGDQLKGKAGEVLDDVGGPGGIAKEAVSGLIPGLGGGGDDDGGKGTMRGVGKGRRMPVQQAVDVAVPLETAYNQWTQYEDWPEFMHRVTRVTQEDECTVSFATKIWGKTKEFVAEIETQRPDERIKWRVSQGITHSGVVTFHELAPNLTRVQLSLDVDPGGLLEKAARGMRHIKRAVRADLHRFQAFIEMQENETGAWRGVIEDGEVVEEHDPSYDEEREYSEVEELYEEPEASEDEEDEDEDSEEEEEQEPSAEADEDEEEEQDEDEDEDDSQRQRSERFKKQAQRSRSRSASRSGSSRSRGNNSSSSKRKASSRK